MSTVPLWAHVAVVLTLLGLHGLTARLAWKRIHELRCALVAKRVMLGKFEGSFEKEQLVVAGEAMQLWDHNQNLLEIVPSSTTTLKVRVFDR
jgi:hypothetical protein